MLPITHLVYFSPTGSTHKIVTAIGRGLGAEQTVHYDVTLPQASCAAVLGGGVAVFGIPVYAGRVPELCLQRLQDFRAAGVPAVLVALYGNRAFEDTLVELRDLVTRQGFKVVAGAAFIGEHSYATKDQPVALGRPDSGDLEKAVTFGRQIADKLEQGKIAPPALPGNTPYRDRVRFGGIAPVTLAEKCTLCGQCAASCPPGVITLTDRVTTAADNCIMCCACIKNCQPKARIFSHDFIREKRQQLVENCSRPKIPQTFL